MLSISPEVMKLLINCSNLTTVGGIQVAHSFINELKKYTDYQFIIVCSNVLSEQLDFTNFPTNFVFYIYNIKAGPTRVIFSYNRYLNDLVSKHDISRVFTLFGPSYWKPKVLHICGFAKPQYVYKESPFFLKLKLKNRIGIRIKEMLHMYDFRKNTDILITENPDVTKRLMSICQKRIFTVTNNFNQIFDNELEWDKSIVLPGFDGCYILTPSANYPHKNLNIIPEIIRHLKCISPSFEFKFVLTIKPEELKLEEDVAKHAIYLGRININQIPPLYNQVHFMLLPTLLECFSASYAEAMRMGKPILTSDLDFATGICENAAVYFDPLNAMDISEKILRLWEDLSLQKVLVNNGYERLTRLDSAESRASKYMEILAS